MKKKVGGSILDQIGNTPLIQIGCLTSGLKGVEIFAKAEWFNPGGSVKDRAAYRMVTEGIRSGALTKDKVILDSSSGNTAIAYSMIGAALGYCVEMVMPANVSEERKKIVRAYGAKLHLTDAVEGHDGAIQEAHRLAKEDPDKYFMSDQYNNLNNPLAHYETTANEIWEQAEGKVTHFLACVGTTGTITGTSKRLKELNPQIKCIAIEPEDAFHGLEGMNPITSTIRPGIFDPSFIDEVLPINTEKAYEMARRLAREEGIFVGQSSGAVLVKALDLAKTMDQGLIVVIFPDAGDKYLTTRVWE